MRPSAINLTSAILLSGALFACTTDSDDGKASVVKRDSGRSDAGAGDAAIGDFDFATAQLALTCRRAVVTETTRAGFSVEVTDADGDVAPGVYVAIKPSTGNVRADGKAGGGETNSDGVLDFSFIAPHFDFETNIQLEASLSAPGGQVAAQDRCSFQVVTQALRFSTPAANSVIPYDRAVTVKVELAVDGESPSCESNGGGVQLSLDGPAGSGLALSDDGPFEAALCVDIASDDTVPELWVHGGERGGNARLRAALAEQSSEIAVRIIGAPATLRVSADETDIAPNSAANLSATVVDDAGQPVSDVRVSFAITRCAANSCAGGESVSPSEATTDANGNVVAAYFAGATAGAAQITASVDGAPDAALVIRVQTP